MWRANAIQPTKLDKLKASNCYYLGLSSHPFNPGSKPNLGPSGG